MRYPYLLFILIVFANCSTPQEEAATAGADLENFLVGQRLEYLVPAEAVTNRALGVAINFMDTAYCFLTYYNGIEEPERMQPYEFVARWELSNEAEGALIAIRSQLFNPDLIIRSFDSTSCQLETEVSGSLKTVKGLFQPRRMPADRYQSRTTKLQGRWVGKAIDATDSIALQLSASTAQIKIGVQPASTTPWHLSYDGRYILLPEQEQAIMLSQDPMGLPVSDLGKSLYLTQISTTSTVYQQYRVEKTP